MPSSPNVPATASAGAADGGPAALGSAGLALAGSAGLGSAGLALAGRAVAAVGTTAALLVAAPTPSASLAALRHADAAADPTAPIVALAALVAWPLLAWLLLVVGVTLAGRLPGLVGVVATALATRVAPPTVRRAVGLALGLTVAVGALGATPASAEQRHPLPATASALDWPTATPVPSLDWNAGAPPAKAAAPAHAPATSYSAHVTPAAPPAPVVVVAPGDSLWKVAAAHLPAGASDAQVAAAWPTWWAANRDAVGSNPDLIQPGLRLTPPQH